MKKIITIIFTFSFSLSTPAQNWIFGKQLTSSNSISAEADITRISADTAGNVYLAGLYADSISFGPTYIKTPDGWGNPFLAKYDNNGNFQWVLNGNSDGSSTNYPFAFETDKAGNSYIAGAFSDTLTFSTDSMFDSSYYNMFLVKCSPQGRPTWTQQFKLAKASSADAECLSIYKDRSIYVAGKFYDTIMLGRDTLRNGGINGGFYLAKYDSSGNPLWIREGTNSVFGAQDALGLADACDQYGNVYIYGTYSDTLRFDTIQLITDYLHPNMFLIKYDSAGNLKWARTADLVLSNSGIISGQSAYCLPLSVDNAGNIYLYGGYLDTVKFGNYTLTSGIGFYNYFVKYDTGGNVIWAKTIYSPTTTSSGGPCSIKFDKTNHMYLCGEMQDSVYINNNLLICDSTNPSFIAKMDTAANLLCAAFIDNYDDDRNDIVPDPLGNNAFFTGDVEWFQSYCYFGSILINEVGSRGEWGILGKWTCEPTMATETNDKTELIYLFPNPCKGIFNFQISNNEQGIMNVEVFNVLGEKVFSILPQKSHMSFDLTGQPNGVYFYRILDKDGGIEGRGKLVVDR